MIIRLALPIACVVKGLCTLARYDVIPRVGQASSLTAYDRRAKQADRRIAKGIERDRMQRRATAAVAEMERRFAAHVDHHAVGSGPVEVPLRGTPLATLADALVDATNTLRSVLRTHLRPTGE